MGRSPESQARRGERAQQSWAKETGGKRLRLKPKLKPEWNVHLEGPRMLHGFLVSERVNRFSNISQVEGHKSLTVRNWPQGRREQM